MKCSKCGYRIDPKFKECPCCSEKISWKERRQEIKKRRVSAKENKKKVIPETDLAFKRSKEYYKAYFGRSSRNREYDFSDYIPIIAMVFLVLIIIISVGLVTGRDKKSSEQIETYVQTETDAKEDENEQEEKAVVTTKQQDIYNNHQNILYASGTDVSASEGDAEKQSLKELDVYQGTVLASVISDIIENGEKRYRDYLFDNENKVTVISEDMLNEDPSGVYDCIWRNIGSVKLTPGYTDNGACAYSFMIDSDEKLHVYLATSEDVTAYEIYPDVCIEYK